MRRRFLPCQVRNRSTQSPGPARRADPGFHLPPYSPELNRIEILWRKVKYEWMAFKTRDSKTLLADLDDIFAKFGEHYQLTF